MRDDFTLAEIGLPTQVELFFRAGDRLGHAPPVIEGQDVLADPAGMLRALCAACGVAFDPAMLTWPPGRRASDGVWAPAWYDAVEKSTGFAPPERRADVRGPAGRAEADRREGAAALRDAGAASAGDCVSRATSLRA